MISKKMQEAINAQINAELWSAYLYLSMSMDAADKGFKGSAHWFVHQFKEEQGHAEKPRTPNAIILEVLNHVSEQSR